MATNISLKSIILEKLNRLLNPNFELKFTWTLLIAGFGLIGYQRLVQLAGSVEIIRPDVRVKLELSSGTDTVLSALGIGLVLLSCLFFYKIKFGSTSVATKTYKTLAAAAADIRKIMEDNRRVFLSFGPNSSAGATGELRHDPSAWHQLRHETICPNNEKIRNILNSIKRINSSEHLLVQKMLSHIEAFAHHCQNPDSNYSDNQFPRGFSDMIQGYCVKANREAIMVPVYGQWLEEKNSQLSLRIVDAHVFGSALFGTETSDVDLLIKSNARTISEVKDQVPLWATLSEDFRARFNLRLHLVVFSQLESDAYVEFISKIENHKKVI